MGAVVVAGCLAERKQDALLKEVPGVDQIVGVFGREEISQVVGRAVIDPRKREAVLQLAGSEVLRRPGEPREVADSNEQKSLFRPAPIRALEDTARLRVTPRHYAYLKISEGCDRTCTFCAIPRMRGKHVTKPIEEVLREARELASDGVRELIVVAQDTTYYGLDLYGRVRLAELLRTLTEIDGIEWIRLLYAYPIHFTDELIETLATSSKIVPYLDLPLQHINDRVLKRMQRRVRRQETETLLGRLREAIPRLALRTTFIVGFPGETEAEFEELTTFAEATRFERAGVFLYSLEPDTPAARLDGQLPDEVKNERRDRLMHAQQKIALEWSRQQVGTQIEAIVDGPDPDVPNHMLARSQADAPEIDCLVRIKGKGLKPGDITSVKITAADGYDLVGKAVGPVR